MMKYIVIALLVLNLMEETTMVSYVPKGCGYRDTYARFGEFPWTAAILRVELGKKDYLINTGSLIHPKVVLTSGYLVIKEKRRSLAVELGRTEYLLNANRGNKAFPPRRSSVSDIKIHPARNSTTGDYEFALLILSEKVQLDKHIGTICLPAAENIFEGHQCLLIGWGDRHNDPHKGLYLQQDISLIIQHEVCERITRGQKDHRKRQLPRSNICTGDLRSSPCLELTDENLTRVGSPLICPISEEDDRFVQAGLLSRNLGCRDEYKPAIHGNIALARPWIDDTMKSLSLDISSYVISPSDRWKIEPLVDENLSDVKLKNIKPSIFEKLGCGIRAFKKDSEMFDPEWIFHHKLPWRVSVYAAALSPTDLFITTGSLIHPKVVMSIHEIFGDLNPGILTIMTGDPGRNYNTQFGPSRSARDVAQILKCGSNVDVNCDHLHLLVVSEPFVLDENVNTVCLPQPEMIYEEEYCIATGYSSIGSTYHLKNGYKVQGSEIINGAVHRQSFPNINERWNSFFCRIGDKVPRYAEFPVFGFVGNSTEDRTHILERLSWIDQSMGVLSLDTSSYVSPTSEEEEIEPLTYKEPSDVKLVEIKPSILHKPGCGMRYSEVESNMSDPEWIFSGGIPWRVSVFKKLDKSQVFFVTGGSLIHPKVVLTTTHRFGTSSELSPPELIVRTGEWNPDGKSFELPSQTRNVTKILICETNIDESCNDFNILVLSAPILLVANVNTVCLPSPANIYGEKQCVATGWSTNPYNPKYLRNRYKVKSTKAINAGEYKHYFDRIDEHSRSFFCRIGNKQPRYAEFPVFGLTGKSLEDRTKALRRLWWLDQSMKNLGLDTSSYFPPSSDETEIGSVIIGMKPPVNSTTNPIPTDESASRSCGKRYMPDARPTFASSTLAYYGEYPWMVAIFINNPQTTKYLCSGSLIHPEVILTAAQCVYGELSSRLAVRAGDWETEKTIGFFTHQDRKVSEIIIHDDYDDCSKTNDFALLFLSDTMKFTSNVGTICLPEQDATFDEPLCYFSDWFDGFSGSIVDIEVSVSKKNKCSNFAGSSGAENTIDKSFICAGGDILNCGGSAGGPLVCPSPDDPNRYVLAGTTSLDPGCVQGRFTPQIYGNVASARLWIDQQMEDNGFDPSSYIFSSSDMTEIKTIENVNSWIFSSEIPWRVSVFKKSNSETQDSFVTRGSLIHSKVVLTTTYRYGTSSQSSPPDLIVRTGEWDPYKKSFELPPQTRDVTKILTCGTNVDKFCDVFNLLVLSTPFLFDGNVNTVCLPGPDNIYGEKQCVVTGWSTNPHNHKYLRNGYRVRSTKAINAAEYKRFFEEIDVHSRSFFCRIDDQQLRYAEFPVFGLTGKSLEDRTRALKRILWVDQSMKNLGFDISSYDPTLSDKTEIGSVIIGTKPCDDSIANKIPAVESVSRGCGKRYESSTISTLASSTLAKYGEYPWMVAIFINDAETTKYLCSGSLIHPEVILTAAQCVYGERHLELAIRAGDWETEKTVGITTHQDRKVSEIIIHDDYDDCSKTNDFALLFLSDPIEFTSNVGTICLPEQDATFDEPLCYFSDWSDGYSGSIVDIELSVSKKNKCSNSASNSGLGHTIDKSFICADGEVLNCGGSAGGPLVCPYPDDPNRYVLAGTTSLDPGCIQGRFISRIYGNVASARLWIDQQMEDNGFDPSYYEL